MADDPTSAALGGAIHASDSAGTPTDMSRSVPESVDGHGAARRWRSGRGSRAPSRAGGASSSRRRAARAGSVARSRRAGLRGARDPIVRVSEPQAWPASARAAPRPQASSKCGRAYRFCAPLHSRTSGLFNVDTQLLSTTVGLDTLFDQHQRRRPKPGRAPAPSPRPRSAREVPSCEHATMARGSPDQEDGEPTSGVRSGYQLANAFAPAPVRSDSGRARSVPTAALP